jgi:hypothetical protein
LLFLARKLTGTGLLFFLFAPGEFVVVAVHDGG